MNELRIVLILAISIQVTSHISTAKASEPSSSICPGLYCGRQLDSSGNLTECGACPRSHRPDSESICTKCGDTPTFYDWLYLGFMASLALALHWFFIDITNRNKSGKLTILHISAFIECTIAAVCSLLLSEPLGYLTLTSCHVQGLSDWYTMLYNPSPDYVHTLHCTVEAVYPLYSVVMIYYAFGIVSMMLMRPFLSNHLVMRKGTKSIYAGLYFFPILIVLHAILAGLVYYSFPYIVLVLSVITNAAHFASFRDQSVKNLIKKNVTNPRNVLILFFHWIMHAYGIIAVTQLTDPTFHAPMLCLIPFPSLFYLLTVRFTDPDKLDVVN